MGAWEDGFAAGWAKARAAVGSPRELELFREPMEQASQARKKSKRKPRKLTAYNRFMKREMKALRRKHPRMKQPQLMKKAAKAWRRKKRG